MTALDTGSVQTTSGRNIWVLTVAQSLGGANAPIVISLGGLVGQQSDAPPTRENNQVGH